MFMNLPRNPSGAFDAANGIGGGNADKAKELRLAVENLLSELHLDEKQVGRILETLDEHAPLNRLDDDDPNAERARELAGDDDDDKPEDKLRALLRDAGLSDSDIEQAISIARDSVKAKDKKAKDQAMDEAALASLDEELNRRFGCGRIVGEPVQAADHRSVADDSDAAIANFNAMYPQAERIGHA
jgi:hypothetical protein